MGKADLDMARQLEAGLPKMHLLLFIPSNSIASDGSIRYERRPCLMDASCPTKRTSGLLHDSERLVGLTDTKSRGLA